jgi:hypothetical protein
MLNSEIHKGINSVQNKEELPQKWKEPIILPIPKEGGKTKCSIYKWISPLSAA